ncbi:hypothetical protein [Microvirga thermotolerans]|uniref:hypothetical protein n=1 Tax=Microvirga thermotolerans TaxID=2651334 RepID=UPI001FEBDB75|nr:hypothetical protein [Microvirga thermotolerans]
MLHDLVHVPGIPVVRLVRVHRQAATEISLAAAVVREGRMPDVGARLDGSGAGVVFLKGPVMAGRLPSTTSSTWWRP